MCATNASGYPAPVRSAGEVGLFSFDRWGVAALATLGMLFSGGAYLLLRWTSTRGDFSLTMSAILLGGGVVIFVVKAAENMERANFRGYDPVGKTGVVSSTLGGRAIGSVTVDGLDWSAMSKGNIELGETVIVVRRDGLHLFVAKKDQLVLA